ncbi:caspase family protein, partial [Acinetobacter baumannii]
IAAALKRLGFAVTLIRNGSFDDMRRSLIAFGREAAGADMATVYFAGHGMEINGDNWLIPVDAELKRDTDAANEAISLQSV